MKFTYKIELSFYKPMVRAFQIVNKKLGVRPPIIRKTAPSGFF